MPREWNCLAEHMARCNGTAFNEPQWSRCDSTSSWLGSQSHEMIDFELRKSFGLTNKWLDGTPHALREGVSGIVLDQAAREDLASSFLTMLRDQVDIDLLYLYTRTSENRFYELRRTVIATDVIAASTWLEDPTPLHYFGPKRIH